VDERDTPKIIRKSPSLSQLSAYIYIYYMSILLASHAITVHYWGWNTEHEWLVFVDLRVHATSHLYGSYIM